MGPRSASTGGEVGTASTAARTRSCSLLNLGRSRSLTARCTARRRRFGVMWSEALESGGTHLGQGPVCAHERALGGRVGGDPAEVPRLVGQHRSHCAGEHRGGEGPPSGGGDGRAPRSSASRYGVRKVTAAIRRRGRALGEPQYRWGWTRRRPTPDGAGRCPSAGRSRLPVPGGHRRRTAWCRPGSSCSDRRQGA